MLHSVSTISADSFFINQIDIPYLSYGDEEWFQRQRRLLLAGWALYGTPRASALL